jgi:hypothetical protein
MAAEITFGTPTIKKVSDKEISISYTKKVEQNIVRQVSIAELRKQKESILKAIEQTNESKVVKIAEADRSIFELQGQADQIDFLIAEGLKTGVEDEV